MDNYSPLVVLFLDGFGVSSSWKGNAILGAKPKNYNYLLENYFFCPLKLTNQGKNNNLFTSGDFYTTIGTGKSVQNSQEIIVNKIKDRSFYDNVEIFNLIKNSYDNNSAIHLVINITSEDDLLVLDSFLSLVKSGGYLKLFLHIIVAGTSDILSVQKIIEKNSIGEIITVSKNDIFDSNSDWVSYENLFSAISGSGGKVVSSPKEIIDIFSDLTSTACVIKQSGFPRISLQDNDSLCLINSDNQPMTEIFMFFSGLHRTNLKSQFIKKIHLTVFRPLNIKFNIPVKYYVAFPDSKISQNLSEIISISGLSQSKIFPKEKNLDLCYYFSGCNDAICAGETRINIAPENYLSTICDEISHSLTLKIDIVFASMPLLSSPCPCTDYKKTVDDILKIDKQLAIIFNKVNSADGTLLLASAYNGAENLTKDLLFNQSPACVPFVLAGKNYQITNQKIISQIDLLNCKNNLPDIFPTIIDLLKLPIPSNIDGKTLLNN